MKRPYVFYFTGHARYNGIRVMMILSKKLAEEGFEVLYYVQDKTNWPKDVPMLDAVDERLRKNAVAKVISVEIGEAEVGKGAEDDLLDDAAKQVVTGNGLTILEEETGGDFLVADGEVLVEVAVFNDGNVGGAAADVEIHDADGELVSTLLADS